jgi:putative ABC transport system permease protein
VIVVFVVTNAMAMAIIERTREIGTLRALGTLPGQLMGSLALEGMLLGGVGALLGAAAVAGGGRCCCTWCRCRCRRRPGAAVGYPLNITIDPQLIPATLLAMVLLTMLASAWWPAAPCTCRWWMRWPHV